MFLHIETIKMMYLVGYITHINQSNLRFNVALKALNFLCVPQL